MSGAAVAINPIPAIESAVAAERLAELITSSWISHAIGAGIELGVFDTLSEAPVSVEDLAGRLNCVPATVAQLLRGCESLELCSLGSDGSWATTPMGVLLASRAERVRVFLHPCRTGTRLA